MDSKQRKRFVVNRFRLGRVCRCVILPLLIVGILVGSVIDSPLNLKSRLSIDQLPFRIRIFERAPSDEPFTIFYQIFIPSDRKGRQNALRIVGEQMKQAREAVAEGRNKVRLYYYTVGTEIPNRLKEFHYQRDHCSSILRCIHGGHALTGTEDFTLGALRDFCVSQLNFLNGTGTHHVSYIHSKGTYHQSRVNENWRFHLTAAALHPSCRNRSDVCDVCGLQFFTEWALFFPGNMFTSQCQYVSKLLDPLSFEIKNEDATGELLFLRWMKILSSNLYSDRIDRFGLDRYHCEQWISSHPSLRPCDMSSSDSLKPWLTTDKRHDFELALAPRHRGAPADRLGEDALQNIWQTHDSKSEIFYLAGILLKFFIWYGPRDTPGLDSWLWESFPDGQFWKRIVALGIPMSPERISSVLPTPTETMQNLKWTGHNSYQLFDVNNVTALFLQIDSKSSFWLEQFNAIKMSLKSTTHRRISIFYQILQSSLGFDGDGTQIERHSLCLDFADCHHLPPIELKYEGETLNSLHAFCRQQPLSSVVYIGKQLSQHEDMRPGLLEAIQTTLGDECSMKGCNICGQVQLAAAGFFFLGDTWKASCSYITRLSPVPNFLKQMTTVAKKMLMLQMKRRIVLKIFDASDYLMVEADLLKHWVTSHPSLELCPVSTSPVHPRKGLPMTNLSFLHSHGISNYTPDIIIRECSFFACHILRWNILYGGEQPQRSSWIWDWFPDYNRTWFSVSASNSSDELIEAVTAPFVETGLLQ